MIVNLQDLIQPNERVTFSSVWFFSAVIMLYLSWGYRLGAEGQAGVINMATILFSAIASFGYPIITLIRHKRTTAIATSRYLQHLDALSEKELLALFNHQKINRASWRLVGQTGKRRFSHQVLGENDG